MIVNSTEAIYGMMDEMFTPQNILKNSIQEALQKSIGQV
jgi:hypothetical protein